MNEQPQLEESPPNDALALYEGGKPTTLAALRKSSGSEEALIERLADSEVSVKGHQSGRTIFMLVGRTVCKLALEFITPGCQFKMRDAARTSRPAPITNISVTAATEAELVNALSLVRSDNEIVVLGELLKLVRAAEAPAAPLQVTITNANELAPAGKVMTVKRDSSGKLSGAVVESVPDPS